MVRWSGFAGVAVCAVTVALSACQQDAGKPAVSLEQAKAVQANLQGQQAFTPPARTISDITAILDEFKPDPGKLAELGRQADATPPAGAAGSELADFYFHRSEAAYLIGRRTQQLTDIREAIRVARAANLDSAANQYLRYQMTAEMFAGNTRNALAIAEERAAAARQSGKAGIVAASHAAVGLLRLRMGDLDGARDAMLAAERALSNPRFANAPGYQYISAEPRSQILRGWGQIAEESGDYAKAEEFYRRNLADLQWIKANEATIRSFISDAPADSLVARDIALGTDLAKLLRKQGRQVEAEVEARRVLVVALRYYGRYSLPAATALTNLAAVIYEQGRVAETLKLVDVTLGIYQQLGAGRGSHWVASLYALRARAQARQNDFQAALASWQSAIALYPEGDAERYLHVESRPAYGTVLMRVGRIDEALKVLQRIADDRLARLGDKNYDSAEARGFLAAALAKAGQRERALAEFHAAVPVLLQASRQSGDAEVASSDRDQRLQIIIEAYIELLAQLKTVTGIDVPAETFRMADAIRARGVQRALAESAARGALGDPALQQLARQEQDAQKQVAALYGLLNSVLSAPPDQQDAGAVTALRSQIDRLREARAVLRQEIERRFPDYVNLVDPRPLPAAEVQALLHRGEALVSLYVGTDSTFVWAMAPQGTLAFGSAPLGEKKVAAMVAELRRALDPNAATLGDIPAYNVALAQQLYAELLQPVAATLQGADTLLIVPDKALGQLPFGLLVTRAGAQPGDTGGALFSGYRGTPFLIREAAVAQLPSIAALATLRRTPPGPATRRAFAGFGDPWFSPAQAREAAAPVALATRGVRTAALQTRSMPLQRRSAPATETVASADIAMLPRLPDTADEVRSIAGALHADPKTDVFLGAAASEQRVKSMTLADRRVVMFATHGLVPGDLNGLAEPALALSAPAVTGATGDGLLTMSEILGLRLNADWIVLSACNTASGDGAGAEAVSGLGRAFFYAGTRAVLVTNWPVETTSARQLTTDLFRRQADLAGVTRAQAMRQAMLALIDGDGYVEGGKTVFSYAHPIFWAPFSLVGDGGI